MAHTRSILLRQYDWYQWCNKRCLHQYDPYTINNFVQCGIFDKKICCVCGPLGVFQVDAPQSWLSASCRNVQNGTNHVHIKRYCEYWMCLKIKNLLFLFNEYRIFRFWKEESIHMLWTGEIYIKIPRNYLESLKGRFTIWPVFTFWMKHGFTKGVFIVYCNAAAVQMYWLLIYRRPTQRTAPQVK